MPIERGFIQFTVVFVTQSLHGWWKPHRETLVLFQVGTAEPTKKCFFLSRKIRAQWSSETRLPGGESSGWEEALAGVGKGAPQNESLYDVKSFRCESMTENACKGEKKPKSLQEQWSPDERKWGVVSDDNGVHYSVCMHSLFRKRTGRWIRYWENCGVCSLLPLAAFTNVCSVRSMYSWTL